MREIRDRAVAEGESPRGAIQREMQKGYYWAGDMLDALEAEDKETKEKIKRRRRRSSTRR
ncbi:MAG: hypothetical protein II951_10735 [Bacteroidales bacterium]|nr:hypothetical protein [Bacteroidales bacterium]